MLLFIIYAFIYLDIISVFYRGGRGGVGGWGDCLFMFLNVKKKNK